MGAITIHYRSDDRPQARSLAFFFFSPLKKEDMVVSQCLTPSSQKLGCIERYIIVNYVKEKANSEKEKKNGKSRQSEIQKGYEKDNKIIVISSSSENNIYVATKM